MFSRFICINYMKTGKCTNKSCTLQHVTDIDDVNDGPADKQPIVQKTTVKKPANTAAEESKRKPANSNSSISLVSDHDSDFQPATKVKKGVLLA